MSLRRFVSLFLFSILLIPLSAFSASPARTPLDDYVAAPDPSYSWTMLSTEPFYGFAGTGESEGTIYTAQMISQKWRNESDSNRSTWTHFLYLAVPFGGDPGTVLLIINGGSVRSTPSDISEYAFIASLMGCSLAMLDFIPNEPIRFTGEAFNRTEDAIIAYTYDKYMDLYQEGEEHPEPEWPLLMPMVKSSVRAMDTIEAIMDQYEHRSVNQFIVGGASKRGWTTWLTGAVDKRVKGIVPIVIDVLNMGKQMKHHKNAYSSYDPNDGAHHMYKGYSDAVDDYTAFDIFDRLDTPEGRALMEIIDPFTYRDRLTMPKMIVNSTGDQFFLSDGIKFYHDYLPGPTYLMYMPNTDHSLNIDASNMAVLVNLLSFLKGFIPNSGVTFPKIDWAFQEDGSIRVATEGTPQSVTLWQAHNDTNRDFRLENVGAIWTASELTDPDGDGVYIAAPPIPTSGWTGFFVEVTQDNIQVCSGLRVIPDVYPNGEAAPDVTAPGFSALIASPLIVRSGHPVNLTVAASESLAETPVMTVNGRSAAFSHADGLHYTFTYTPIPEDAEGEPVIVVTGTDLEENEGRSEITQGFTVDDTVPALTSLTVTPTLARPGDLIQIHLACSEALLGDPEVTLNGHAATAYSGKADGYDYTYRVAKADSIGPVSIHITMTDIAGNEASVEDTITLTFAPAVPLYALPAFLILAVVAFFIVRRRTAAEV